MGIQIEFNPDLALRKFGTKGRLEDECLPKNIEAGKFYDFLKEGQRNYWFFGEIPLVETKGNGELSRPLASITIQRAIHLLKNGKMYTKGIYKVNEVYDIDDKTIHFEGINKII
ncbi:MAG: hypothetical protein PHH54_00870 [Candidatus Nanoarchaeia archaeon]|nr:hypothetical protein [Candidatus Nanoarchaeia archaeon]MDD5740515.1 hypothetical protein [Candidatus Nanoarchaeia archaeon]